MPGRVFTQTAARRRSLRAWDWHPPDLGRPSDPSGLRAPNLGGAPPTSRQRRADAHPGASSRTPLGESGSMSPSTGSRQARGRHLSTSGAMEADGQKTKKTTHETALPPGSTRSIPHGGACRIPGEHLAAAITEGRAGLPAFLSGSSEGREDGVGGCGGC